MNKTKFFLNYDKEEKWLVGMAAQGWQLIKTGFSYTFVSAPPEQAAVIRIDYRQFKKEQDFADYCSLFEDSGWRHIAGTKRSGAQYFRKIGNDGSDDIFSDSSSRAGRYKRLSDMWMSIWVVFLPILVALMTTSQTKISELFDLKALYLTPGLWDMSGWNFWWHFLFETPFVILRSFSWIIWLMLFFVYVFFAIKSQVMYKKTLKSNE
jgi:hypothetical protein